LTGTKLMKRTDLLLVVTLAGALLVGGSAYLIHGTGQQEPGSVESRTLRDEPLTAVHGELPVHEAPAGEPSRRTERPLADSGEAAGPTPLAARREAPVELLPILLRGHVDDPQALHKPFQILVRKGDFRREQETDVLGRFELRVPEAGKYWFIVQRDDHDWMTSKDVSEQAIQLLAFEHGGSLVTGRVEGLDGVGLAGIRVRLKWSPKERGAQIPRPPKVATTNAVGDFEFHHVPDGDFILELDGRQSVTLEPAGSAQPTVSVATGVATPPVTLTAEPQPRGSPGTPNGGPR